MSDDAERAREAEARVRADAERIAAEAQTSGEALRQSGVIYGGLIAIGVVMLASIDQKREDSPARTVETLQ